MTTKAAAILVPFSRGGRRKMCLGDRNRLKGTYGADVEEVYNFALVRFLSAGIIYHF